MLSRRSVELSVEGGRQGDLLEELDNDGGCHGGNHSSCTSYPPNVLPPFPAQRVHLAAHHGHPPAPRRVGGWGRSHPMHGPRLWAACATRATPGEHCRRAGGVARRHGWQTSAKGARRRDPERSEAERSLGQAVYGRNWHQPNRV